MYNIQQSRFKGEKTFGKFKGKGEYIFPDGSIYKGMFH